MTKATATTIVATETRTRYAAALNLEWFMYAQNNRELVLHAPVRNTNNAGVWKWKGSSLGREREIRRNSIAFLEIPAFALRCKRHCGTDIKLEKRLNDF